MSAASALPLHLLPLLVAAVIAQGRLPVAQAGWVASACLLGQLTAAITLPLMGFTYVKRGHAAVCVAALLLALHGSNFPFAGSLLAAWFAVGLACGNLYFLATTTAAAAINKEAAFALRLCLSLIVSGLTIFALQLGLAFSNYAVLVIQLSVVFIMLTLIGLWLYEPPATAAAESVQGVAPIHAQKVFHHRSAGLAVVFLLFLGQTGFWAYAVQTVQQRNVSFSNIAYAIAFSKILAGVWLYGNSKYRAKTKFRANTVYDFLIPGAVLVIALLCMSLSRMAPAFMLGVLLWELSLNLLGARLQAAVVDDNPRQAGVWITAAVFLGACIGPALHGASINMRLGDLFVGYACLSALIPSLWFKLKH